MTNKKIIKTNFEKYHNEYNDRAVVQKKMAEKLISFLKENEFDKVLEIGCGTGFLTQCFIKKKSFNEFYANDITDISKRYIESMIKEANFITGDAEKTDLPANINLVMSNAMLQWSQDFPGMILKIKDCLIKNGIFLFSTFGTDNFKEIRELTGVGLKYYSVKEITNFLKPHFEIIRAEEQKEKIYFFSFKEILSHIKHTGVNSTSSVPITISQLKKLEREYESTFRSDNGLVLTYNPLYIYARKL